MDEYVKVVRANLRRDLENAFSTNTLSFFPQKSLTRRALLANFLLLSMLAEIYVQSVVNGS